MHNASAQRDHWAMARANARRYVYPLILIAIAAWFDYRLKGEILTTLVIGAMAVAPLLFAPIVRPIATSLFGWIPPRFRTLAAAAVPASFLFLTRWRGSLDLWTALVVIAAPVAVGAASVVFRRQLAPVIRPIARVRDRYLPRWLRMTLATLVPILLAFGFVHGSLSDFGALFGGSTNDAQGVGAPGIGARMVLATAASTVLAYLLLTEPAPLEER